MSLVALEIKQCFERYAKRMALILLCSLNMMIFTAACTFSFPMSLWLVVFVLAILPTCLLLMIFRIEMKNPIGFYARRLKLTEEQTQELRLAMGLLNWESENANAFEDTLRDRVLTRWQESLTRACKVGWVPKVLLLLHGVLLLSMIVFHLSKQRDTPPDLPIVIASENAVESSTDVQQGPTRIDAIASALLRMQQQLEMISESTSDEQFQELQEQLNQLWQGIHAMDSDAAAEIPVQSQLQTASHMPLSGSRSLQSQALRESLSESLAQDIQTLARMGARFGGPGKMSRGQSHQIQTPAANPAEGRYHEYTGKLTPGLSDTVIRRIEQVPPRYRQAVARYLADLQEDAQNEKARKGVKP